MRALLDRLPSELSPADALGLAIALLGCVVATVVALRVPLLAAIDPPPAAPAPVAGDTDPADPGAVGTPVTGTLLVHVAGAVVRPGVIELDAGERVADALAAVGGPTPDADLAALNLARPLVDGEQVLVPVVGASPVASAGEDGTSVRLHDGRLDLNAATASDLEELPGVGPVLAGRIVAHREANGPFTEASGLRDVSGIGEATWASLRDLVGVR